MSSEVKGHFRRDGSYVSPHTRRNNNPGRATEKARDVKGQLGDFSPTSYQEPEPLTGTHAYHNILKDVRAGQVRRGDINDLHEESCGFTGILLCSGDMVNVYRKGPHCVRDNP